MIDILKSLIKKISKQFQPYKIYLFGSQAKGTAGAGSDIDLLIIADLPGPKHQRNLMISRLFPDRRFSLDVLVYNQQEFEEEVQIPSTIGYTVAREGKLLYAR
jgi:predicted nucleotidyltransferase